MSRAMRVYCLLAGLCDATTGLLLIAVPGELAARLGLEPKPAQPDYLAFSGVFVLTVGLSYLYPFALAAVRREARLAAALETTALARFAVAAFLTAAIAAGRFGTGWLPVLATDLSLAIFQTVWRLRGEGGL